MRWVLGHRKSSAMFVLTSLGVSSLLLGGVPSEETTSIQMAGPVTTVPIPTTTTAPPPPSTTAAPPTTTAARVTAQEAPERPHVHRTSRKVELITGTTTTAPAAVLERRNVSSTAYCLTSRTANGGRGYVGSVAMNGVPFGSKWRVVQTGKVYTVNDRIGHSSQFDIWMPSCSACFEYGRRQITIERIA